MVQLKQQMESDLISITSWLTNNKLQLNVSKTQFLIFYLKHKPQDIVNELTYNGSLIKRVESYRYLGLSITSQLNWNDHINSIKSKISPIIGVLRRIGHYVPYNLRSALYFAYIHSHLTYLIQIWGAASYTHIHDLQVLQNKSIKALRNLPRLTSTKTLYSDQILPVTELVSYEYIMTIYKIKFNLIKCNTDFPTNISITHRTTRNATNYRLPNYRLSTTQNSVFYKGVELFNQLDSNKKDAKIAEF